MTIARTNKADRTGGSRGVGRAGPYWAVVWLAAAAACLTNAGPRGPARVLSIGPCPEIPPGPGQVVTGTFAHTAGNVVDLYLEGQGFPLGVTANHPIWSEDRARFVPAGDLRPGETLRSLCGPLTVAFLLPRPAPEPVFNLEVAAEHVYHVSAAGVLVHNAYGQGNRLTVFRGGAYEDLAAVSGQARHHMPAKSISPIPDSVGPAIQMDWVDHLLTSSYGSTRAATAYRAEVGAMIKRGEWRRAMAIEIRDVRRAALVGSGDRTRYNAAIKEMLGYAGWLGK